MARREIGFGPGISPVTIFFGGVVLAASAVLFVLFEVGPTVATGSRWLELPLFVLLMCVCELKPVTVARSTGVQEVVASTTFTFVIFLSFGPMSAIAAQTVASLLGDVSARKNWFKTLFNVAQYALAWGLAGIVFDAVVTHQGSLDGIAFTWRWTAALVASGVVYFLANNALIGSVIAISAHAPVWQGALGTIVREASSDVVLLALSPIVIVAADRSLLLLPVLLLPVLGVYRSALLSADKEHQAMHDALTDLPNRLNLGAMISRRLDSPKANGTGAAILLIDLDRFKEVNDTLGHQAGDALLCEIGPRIQAALPEGGVVARFGGDEFAVMLPEIHVAEEALRVGRSIAEAFQTPFRVEGFNLEVEASIGAAVFPTHGLSADILIKRADIAMYVAKTTHSGVQLYAEEQDHHSTRRLGLLSELRTALADGQVALYYQPKLDLATGSVTTVEALVRWHHPILGMIAPAEFVPFAEHTGLIRPLTSFVLRAAVAQAAAWRDAGLEIAVAMNLSARSLHDGAISDEIAAVLSEFVLPARLLQLEITESSIMADPTRAKRVLEQLDGMGLHLTIDDFGTGYSSLAYLQDLPVREVKIDRSFVTN
ncbi:MAG: hypothetical protein QOD72_1887, partial [Acidimicrobiaceae bacterium]|nr:hypothetical protein [Acidimicrobiaceae bacterium]